MDGVQAEVGVRCRPGGPVSDAVVVGSGGVGLDGWSGWVLVSAAILVALWVRTPQPHQVMAPVSRSLRVRRQP